MNTTIPNLRSASLFVANHDDVCDPVRIVDVYELEYHIADGGISEINGVYHHIRKGTIIIAKPGDKRHLEAQPFCCLYLHLKNVTGELKQILDSLPSTLFTQDPSFDECFRSIIKLFISSNISDHLVCSGMILQLVGNISKLQYSASATDAQSNRIVASAMRFININYAKYISVDDVAKYCSVSTSYLHKLFAKTQGTTPHDAIIERRIMAAKHLLMNTKLSLSEVAEKCGFRSQAYFSDCFRKRADSTPSQFRYQTSYKL